MNQTISTTSPQLGQRVKHRSTGETGTITAIDATARGTYMHVSWDDSEALEMPSSLRVDYVELLAEILTTAATVSYYDMTLALIGAAVDASTLTRKDIAAGVGISTDTLRLKLSGEETLMVSEIGTIADVLGCRMSAIVA